MCVCVCVDFPETSAGVRAADGKGGGHDFCQLEGTHHVQHQIAQVRPETHTDLHTHTQTYMRIT